MTDKQIGEMLLKAGVRTLKEFGYPDVTTENIVTDPIYKAFFIPMLEDSKNNNVQMNRVIDAILKTLENDANT